MKVRKIALLTPTGPRFAVILLRDGDADRPFAFAYVVDDEGFGELGPHFVIGPAVQTSPDEVTLGACEVVPVDSEEPLQIGRAEASHFVVPWTLALLFAVLPTVGWLAGRYVLESDGARRDPQTGTIVSPESVGEMA